MHHTPRPSGVFALIGNKRPRAAGQATFSFVAVIVSTTMPGDLRPQVSFGLLPHVVCPVSATLGGNVKRQVTGLSYFD